MQSVWTSKVYSVHKPPWIKAKSTISNMSVLQILDVKTWTLSLKTTWNEGAGGANITHATMRDSMKGEITRSKRHLKGHRSKLSFSRLAATHGSHLDFSHTPLCSRAAAAVPQTIRLLIAPLLKFGGKSGNFAGHWFLWPSEHTS